MKLLGTLGLSVMATQASAITFLSTPGKPTMTEWALCNSILITHSDGCHLRYFYPIISQIQSIYSL
jgi:hypothetical protein